jgi:hypothetical protein
MHINCRFYCLPRLDPKGRGGGGQPFMLMTCSAAELHGVDLAACLVLVHNNLDYTRYNRAYSGTGDTEVDLALECQVTYCGRGELYRKNVTARCYDYV